MKIRTDFVTNSSSSSFILARKGDLTEAQKAAVLDAILEDIMGEVWLTPDNTKEEVEKQLEDYYVDEEQIEDIRQALKDGKTVYQGSVYFDDCEDYYSGLLQRMWKLLEQNGNGNFIGIDTDLDY